MTTLTRKVIELKKILFAAPVVGALLLSACGAQPQYQAVCVNPFTHTYLDAALFCHGGFGQFVYVPYSGSYHSYQPGVVVVHYVPESQVRSSRVQYPAKFTPSPGQKLVGKKISVYDPNNKAGIPLKKAANGNYVQAPKKTTPLYGTPPDPKRVKSDVQDRPYKAPPKVNTYKKR